MMEESMKLSNELLDFIQKSPSWHRRCAIRAFWN